MTRVPKQSTKPNKAHRAVSAWREAGLDAEIDRTGTTEAVGVDETLFNRELLRGSE